MLFSPIASVFSGTRVTFQSSDGLWGQKENSFRGRKFLNTVILFEEYKIKCNVPAVTLQRVTERPESFSVEGLYDDYSDAKWKVPLADNAQPNKVGSFEPECAKRGIFDSELKLATARAYMYINSLKGHAE
jgi:hypothetical protein